MKTLIARSSKGQMKIQQMAFVLVATFIFFSMVAIFYFSIRMASLKQDALQLRQDEAKETVLKLAGTPEFTAKTAREDCSNCVDFDKLLALKEIKGYESLWGLNYVAVRVDYPEREKVECTRANYPNCNQITLAGANKTDVGLIQDAFVAVCRWMPSEGGYRKCEVGKVLAAGDIID